MIWVIAGALLAVVALLYGLHRTALWAERRGWLYYRNSRPPAGAGLGLLAPIYSPGMEHVVEESSSERVRADADDSGDAPPVAS